MTCVIGVVSDYKVYMGGDASSVDEHSNFISTRKEPKVFVKGPYIFGYAGSFRFGKVIEHIFVPPKPQLENIDRFLNTVFIDALRQCCEESKVDPSSEQDSAEMLLGINGRLFEFCNDWHFGEDSNNFNAIGSGTSFAMGSLYSTRRIKSPHARIKTALEAAEKFSTSVSGPFTILEA